MPVIGQVGHFEDKGTERHCVGVPALFKSCNTTSLSELRVVAYQYAIPTTMARSGSTKARTNSTMGLGIGHRTIISQTPSIAAIATRPTRANASNAPPGPATPSMRLLFEKKPTPIVPPMAINCNDLAKVQHLGMKDMVSRRYARIEDIVCSSSTSVKRPFSKCTTQTPLKLAFTALVETYCKLGTLAMFPFELCRALKLYPR